MKPSPCAAHSVCSSLHYRVNPLEEEQTGQHFNFWTTELEYKPLIFMKAFRRHFKGLHHLVSRLN